jgi:hypothetical protein
MNTFKQKIGPRASESQGAVFWTGKVKVLDPVLRSSLFGFRTTQSQINKNISI